MRSRDDVQVNPHTSAYFAFANLSLTSRFEHPLPPWLSRGLAGVLSNTLVRQKDVIVGAMIPWHLEDLRQRRRPLRQILTAAWGAPELRRNDSLAEFDAHAWAFVHMLMFGHDGKNSARLNNFVAEVAKGTAQDAAFASTIGDIEQYERDFVNYVNRNLFPAIRVKIDAGVDRERFPARKLTEGEAAGARAGFLVSMNRPAEAQAMITQARKVEPNSAAATTAEALLLDRAGDREAAKAAYEKAVSQGSTSAYSRYRLAVLSRPGADTSGLEQIEQHLAKAVELNPNFAAAHASLAETRAELNRSQAMIVPHMHKAVSLEPGYVWHRILAARTLARLGAVPEARKTIETARKLATDDPSAQQEIDRIFALLKDR
jgi:tetratricopeptide (TPR) repeat protein